MLAHMESDDAVDLLGELDEERRRRILELLPPLQARRVRALAGYDPATAGGLMSPDFICLYATATKPEAVERISATDVMANSITSIFTMNLHRRLQGEIRLADLIRAEDDAVLGEIAGHRQASALSPRHRGRGDRAADDRLRPDHRGRDRGQG